MFLPARSPYDRQVLADHVAASLRVTGQVQVLVNEQRWMVRCTGPSVPVYCTGCASGLNTVWAADSDAWTYCAECALHGCTEPVQVPREHRRHAG